MAGEDLAARLTEVLGQEGVENRVNAGVTIGQAVGDDTEGEGGVIQGEDAKLHPHGDDVMRQPADGKGSDNQEDSLSRLQGEERTCLRLQWCLRTIGIFNVVISLCGVTPSQHAT